MQSRGKRIIALLLLALMLFTSIPYDVDDVFAATYNVHQTRRIAEIDDFPISYQAGLTRVKEIYPNAQFIYYDTDLDWYDELLTKDAQLKKGLNLIPSNSPSSWKSDEAGFYDPETDTYTQIEPGWNQASVEIIEYYMDPRNFFNETDIFQFLNLAFDGTQTVEGTQAIINGSFMAKKILVDNDENELSFAEALYQIGEELGVSPYLLACRILQEQGGEGAMISGNYSKVPGYYNYFNIHAAGSTTERILTQGLEYAKSRGWDTPYKSIVGGAQFLVSNYVETGRNSLYLQHFNMTTNKDNNVTYAVYMANTLAPYYENRMMAESLTDKEASYTFIIPVYDNMPEAPCEMPKGKGSGSALLKSLTLNDGSVDIGKFSAYDYSYDIKLENVSSLKINAITHSHSSKVSINGENIDAAQSAHFEKEIELCGGFNTITITVTAENGLCRDYVLNVLNDDGQAHYYGVKAKLSDEAVLRRNTKVSRLKEDISTIHCMILVADASGKLKNNDELCVSGDVLIIKTLDNKLVYSAPIVIYGDVNRDGDVTDNDVNLIKAHILESHTLTLDEVKFADINGDGQITLDDVGAVKMLTGLEVNTYNPDASVSVVVSDDVYDGKSATVTVSAAEGTYLAEGYLTYNEGIVSILNGENSGKIHFIVDGNNVVFSNGESVVEFNSVVHSGSIDFDIKIVDTYDYLLKKDVHVDTTSKSTQIQSTELEVEVSLNEHADEEGSHAATLVITNTSSMSIGHSTISLGEHFTDKNGESSVKLNGLLPGEIYNLELHMADNLSGGHYSSELKIQYQCNHPLPILM